METRAEEGWVSKCDPAGGRGFDQIDMAEVRQNRSISLNIFSLQCLQYHILGGVEVQLSHLCLAEAC